MSEVTEESTHGHRTVNEYLSDTGTITSSGKTIFHLHQNGSMQHRHSENGQIVFTGETEIYQESDGSLQEVFTIGTKRGNDYFEEKLNGGDIS